MFESLVRVLAGDEAAIRSVVARRIPEGSRQLDSFAILPRSAAPRLLVPLSARRAAAVSLRQYNNATGQFTRLGAELLGAAILARLGTPLFRSQLRFVVPAGSGRGLDTLPLVEHLRKILGFDDLQIAVRLGAVRPNRKPVLQLLTPDGTVRGYAKLGWEDITRRLVEHEATVLRGFLNEADGTETFKVPKLLYAGSWHGIELLIVAPVAQPRCDWRAPRLELPYQATAEIGRRFIAGPSPLAASTYWKDLRARVAATGALSGETGPKLLPAVEVLEERHGGDLLTFGSWHGDWLPTNMCWSGGSLYVWDWERSSHDVPLGLDIVHFEFNRARRLRGTTASTFSRAVSRSKFQLTRLDVDPGRAAVLLCLDLLEMSLRFAEARQAGLPVNGNIYRDSLDIILGRV